MELKNKIKQLAKEFHAEVINIRRHLHQHPELSFQEFETSNFIASKLDELNISYQKGFAKTGIIAKIEGKNPTKKVIALRADMDALPIEEENHVDYKSQNTGIMHACGHDVHCASLLGTAKILNTLKDEFEGTVLLIFQPGEESLPGGAKLMMEEGIFKDAEPEIIIAQHVMPTMEAGTVGFKNGMYMASADEIYMTIKGKGGHAAMPHQITDNVLIASHIIVALQQITSRHADASIPTVLSFGKMIANGATNIIPKEVKIEGTFRTMDEKWRAEAHRKIKEIATSIAKGMGAECDIEIRKGYPFLVNDAKVTNAAKNSAIELLGAEKVHDMEIRMTAEDFAYFSQKYPATFYRLGVKNEKKNITSPLHSSTFNIDEDALETATGLMSWMAVSYL